MAGSSVTISLDDWRTRVGASERVDGASGLVYVIVTGGDTTQRIEMSPAQARQLSRRLKRWADALEPPKPRRAKR